MQWGYRGCGTAGAVAHPKWGIWQISLMANLSYGKYISMVDMTNLSYGKYLIIRDVVIFGYEKYISIGEMTNISIGMLFYIFSL